MQEFQRKYEALRGNVFTFQTRTMESVEDLKDKFEENRKRTALLSPKAAARQAIQVRDEPAGFASLEVEVADKKSMLAYASRRRQKRMVKEVDALEAKLITMKTIYEFHENLLVVAGEGDLPKLHKLTWDMSLTGFPFGTFVCNELGETPLIIATRSGCEEVVCELLTYVCREDLDHRDKDGKSALDYAREMRHGNIVRHLGGTWTEEDEREKVQWQINQQLEEAKRQQEELEDNFREDLEGIRLRGGKVAAHLLGDSHKGWGTPDTGSEGIQAEQDDGSRSDSVDTDQMILNLEKPTGADGKTLFEIYNYAKLFERIYAVGKRKEFQKVRSVMKVRRMKQYFKDTAEPEDQAAWSEYATDDEPPSQPGDPRTPREIGDVGYENDETIGALANEDPDLIVNPGEYRPIGYINGGYDSEKGEWYGEEVTWFYKDPHNNYEDTEITEREFLWKISLNEVSMDTMVWSSFCDSEWTKLSQQPRLIPPEFADWDKKVTNPPPLTTDFLFSA